MSAQNHDAYEPVGVTIDAAKALLSIAWADGHQTALPYSYLRGLCPCAVCQGHGGDLSYIEPLAGTPLDLADVLEVGHYALNMVWGDGHRTGIYAMTYLRSLCPCASCRADLGPGHAVHRLPAAAKAKLAMGQPAAPSP